MTGKQSSLGEGLFVLVGDCPGGSYPMEIILVGVVLVGDYSW